MFGPAGAGKTFTALSMAEGLGQKIAVIDSEKGSSAKYSDRFTFDISVLEDKSIDSYIQEIKIAGNLGYDVLIIDSGSHAWQELIEEVDRLANAKFGGNKFAAWSVGTPKQKKFIAAIYDFPGHLIFTMRSKTEYVLAINEKGQQVPKRIGLAPEQGKGVESEFDILIELSVDHTATITKDRTGKFQDEVLEKPGKEFGKALADWLSVGAPPVPKPEKTSNEKYRGLVEAIPRIQRATNLSEIEKKNELLRLKDRWEKIKDTFLETEIHFFNDGRSELINALGEYGWAEPPEFSENNLPISKPVITPKKETNKKTESKTPKPELAIAGVNGSKTKEEDF
ncbi:ATP-binding protein [Leptospira ainazelensis]|uniref:ATP-binding protein n=1 Tax=Leptospira ainazelensis TaxID=2810034 RepID=UPI001E59D8CF|nr:ATP-binding protein [Leptospira ainazelensis]